MKPLKIKVRGTHGSFTYVLPSGRFYNIFDADGVLIDELPEEYARIRGLDLAEYLAYLDGLSCFIGRPFVELWKETHDILCLGYFCGDSGYEWPDWSFRFLTACAALGMADELKPSQLETDPTKFLLLARFWKKCFPNIQESHLGPTAYCPPKMRKLNNKLFSIWTNSNKKGNVEKTKN